MKYSLTRLSLLCVVMTAAHLSAQTPLGTDFTYQGQLKASGLPALTSADFQFSLFDAATVGAQVGSTQAKNNIALVNGAFTLSLDFGAGAFQNDSRWIEVAVRSPAGSGGFTTLSPRQALTPTPQAIFAVKTPGIQVEAPAGELPHLGLGFDVGGGFSEVMRASFDGNVGIGTINPAKPLHVRASEPALILQDQGPAALQTGYVGFWNNTPTPTETAWAGFGTPGSPHFSIVNNRSDGDIRLFTENVERLTVTANGTVHVNGSLTHTALTRSYTIHAFEFQDAFGDQLEAYGYDFDGLHHTGGSSGEDVFIASPHLPDGATIVLMELVGHDGNPFANMKCYLGRTDFAGEFAEMAEVEAETGGPVWQTTDIFFPTIDNDTHAYWLTVEMAGAGQQHEHRFTAVRLLYSITKPLP